MEDYSERLAEAAAYLDRVVDCVIPGCEETSNPWATDLPICMRHLYRANRDCVTWIETYVLIPENQIVVADDGLRLDDTSVSPAQLSQVVTEKTRAQTDRQYAEAQVRRAARFEARKSHTESPAVYYIQMNDKIKIGTTTNLKQRMADFYAQAKDLLAIEPGGREREGQRHREFAGLRHGRTELFTPDPKLLIHIAEVRRMFGNPAKFLESVLD